METRVLSVHHGSRRYGQLLRRLQDDAGGTLVALYAATARERSVLASRFARDLERPLQRIELARIVSRYVRETEKNLSRTFEAARESGAILLFDEADALFGKRTDVKSVHDRYANLQRNRILQRLENQPGTSVLAVTTSRCTTHVCAMIRPASPRAPAR
ncbi:vesicle-fusing ATPase [Luteimonas cucumeris]|uniref:Vesicle-fusing ATPase n=1 Tax=Luteimonas cucumeris TaxID=985012 RepID=A0A562LF15_9GAMM|nr:AAA family ATPase [Luteimonas cucumeris]TWI06201.1 vesicle-fusing ATPase [Luteimonas cucumeris]